MMVHVYNSRIGGRLNVIAGTVLDKIEKLNKLWLDFLLIISYSDDKPQVECESIILIIKYNKINIMSTETI